MPKKQKVEEDVPENQFLAFVINNETYAIEIQNVVEVVRTRPITKIPESLHFLKGVVGLRGKVFPVMDLRLRFNLDEKVYDANSCIIIVKVQNVEMGLLVDSILDVLEIPVKKIEATSDADQAGVNMFLKGIDKTSSRVISLIDLEKLVVFTLQRDIGDL